MSAGPDLDFLGNKTRAGGLERFYGVREIRNVDGDMVQTFAALLHKLCNDRVRAGGFQQLDTAVSQRDHRHFDLLMRDRFLAYDFQSELFIEFARLRQGFYSDSEMVDGVHTKQIAISKWQLAKGACLSIYPITQFQLPNFRLCFVSLRRLLAETAHNFLNKRVRIAPMFCDIGC